MNKKGSNWFESSNGFDYKSIRKQSAEKILMLEQFVMLGLVKFKTLMIRVLTVQRQCHVMSGWVSS